MERYQEVMVALLETVKKNLLSWIVPKRRNHDDVISSLQQNLVISETMYPRWKVNMEHYE